MKRFAYLFTTLVVVLSTNDKAEGQGQYVVKRETVTVEKSNGDKVVNISSDSDDSNRVTVQVAGVEITLGNKPQPKAMLAQDEVGGDLAIDMGQAPIHHPGREVGKTADRPVQTQPKTVRKNRYHIASPGHIAFFEVGINMLPNPDYSAYPNDGTFLDLRHALSTQWAFTIPDVTVKLVPNGVLAVSAGLQIIWNNWTFVNDITLEKQNGRIIPVPTPEPNPKKTKLTTFGLQVPLILEINLPQDFFIAGGVYGGVNIGANTKVKFPKSKMRDPYMNPFYYGVTGRVGYSDFYIYANYGLTGLFQKDKGPKVFPLTIGVGIEF